MVVHEMNFMRRDLGQIIVASAIIDDLIGWIIIAVVFGIARGGSIQIGQVAQSVAGVAAFLLLSLTVGRPAVAFAIRFVNDNFVSELPVITLILIIMGAMALDHRRARCAERPRRLRSRAADWRVADPDQAYRYSAAWNGYLLFCADLFRPRRANFRLDGAEIAGARGAHLWARIDRERRKIRWRISRRRDRPVVASRIFGARHRHERARFDGSHRCQHRPFNRRPEPESLYDDRHNGCANHLRNAADTALGVVAGAAAAR